MEVFYKANDGTIFTDVDECLHYEFEEDSKVAIYQIHGIDRNFNPIPFTSSSFMYDVMAVKIDTPTAAKIFATRAVDCGLAGSEIEINGPGTYFFDGEDGIALVDNTMEYEDLDTALETLEKNYKALKKAKKILEK